MLLAVLSLAGCTGDDCPICPGTPDPAESLARSFAVPGEFATIAEVLTLVAPGDSVLVAGGTYLEHDLVLPSGLILVGTGTADNPSVIDAQGRGRVFSCVELDSLVVLSGLTITGGRLAESSRLSGAGVYCVGSRLRLVECTFVGNAAVDGYGGAVAAITLSELEIEDCRFEGNSCADIGGGVYGDYHTTARISGTVFADNRATGAYGALRTGAGSEVVGCEFVRNRNRAAFMDDGSHIGRCTFRENSGGGLEVADDCEVEGCLFVDNTTLASAGGLYGGHNLHLLNSLFVHNSTPYNGGGAVVYGDSLFVDNCDFIENAAGYDGGGLFARSATIERCDFSGNTAETGGAVHAIRVAVSDCRIRGNRADLAAAIYAGWTSSMTGSALTGNSGRGTVLYFGEGSTLHGCTIAGNEVESDGSLLEFGRSIAVSHCIVAHNTGDLLFEYLEVPAIDHCDLFGNSGGDWSGVLADQAEIEGNFSADPYFCDLAAGNVSLCYDSPCLPNVTGHELVGAQGVGCVACGE